MQAERSKKLKRALKIKNLRVCSQQDKEAKRVSLTRKKGKKVEKVKRRVAT